MASGIEIVPLITSSIEIIKLIQGLYDAIKSYKELPKAFEGVSKQLPLVRHALKVAERRAHHLDDATKVSVRGILQRCEQNIQGILYIFEALQRAEGKSIKDVYTRVVIQIGKRGRVEDLMKATLSNVKRLAENQQFLLADQIQGLQSAIDCLAKIPPSIPTAELEGSSDFQQIGDNNTQNINRGDVNNTSGGTVNAAGTINTAAAGHFTQNNNYSRSAKH